MESSNGNVIPFLLVVVLVLVLGFSGFLDYEHEDENERSPAFPKHALSRSWIRPTASRQRPLRAEKRHRYVPDPLGGIRHMNEIIPLQSAIRADVAAELPHFRETVKWAARLS